jgi:hypothetical protein
MEETVSDVMGPLDTNPAKLDVVAPVIVAVVTPPESRRLRNIDPAAKSPLMLLPKKLPPIPWIVGANPEKTIGSEATFVENEGLPAVPAPYKPVVAKAL